MRLINYVLVGFLVLAGPACAAVKPVVTNHHMTLYKKNGTFSEVRDAVKLAITGQGLVVNNISHIGNMLSRTGKDLGKKRMIYDSAEALEFCSATVSRATMEADPTNIVFCPYIIVIYTLPKEPDSVYLGYRRPEIIGSKESKKSLRAVEALLDKIVREALSW